MSELSAKVLKDLYRRKKITFEGLQKALKDKVITEEEFEKIINTIE